ncbi:unnamed protein product [Medioppia subpectinata]|uniref:Methyltransferase type 11 domain-containing protein n=1 Tax=Medioppia subpectinata TaxID=1979941 RepID=A0A7R9KMI0_9ACAR|nr:unnamed protein product [Medioppia subpectinata]CAG2106256.1 unnamed protein product [Medioppia subpectinata]
MTKECKYGKYINSSSRSLALEQAYVHDVYSIIAINTSLCSPVRSHVKEFLFEEFEIGNCVLDVGCGDGKYLNLKSDIVVIGLERCCEWFCNDLVKCKNIYAGDKQLITGDVMYLPFRDDFFDGVLCSGVLHHVSTVERRVKALREITRILKIGGKILLTVTSGPAVGRELQSQDVLIKLEDFPNKLNTNINSSDTESESSSSGYNNSNYGNTVYESCNTPNSEFGSCYSFVRKALRKFSFTGSFGSLQSRRTSGNKSRTSNGSSLSKEDFPIELRNIEDHDYDDDESISAAIDSPIDCDITSVNDSNRSHSNLLNSSSLLSIIKEHIISFQFQFKSKNSINNESNNKNGFPHRFSLPLSFKRNDKPKSNLNIINRINKNIINETKELETKTQEIINNSKPIANNKGVIRILQKSFSSDSLSSRQASLDTTGAQLIAYYSMPELHTLNETQTNDFSAPSNRMAKNKPKLLELHPITFIDDKTNQNNQCIQTNNSEIKTQPICGSKEENNEYTQQFTDNLNKREMDESVDPIEEKESLLEKEEMDDCVQANESVPQMQSNNKFPKKLLRQRSFSADYQPEVPKAQADQPRRFSASPNIGSTRVNQIAHNYQQINKSDTECQSSTPSPPTTLHRYFHVFRSGELEQLIEQNIQNLHVVNSYYNERATSWCVVVEKVHVWTI